MNYIPPQDRKTILFISDDMRAYSGVGVMTRSIIRQSATVFNWINLAVLYRHNDPILQPIDVSAEIDKDEGYMDSNVIIYPDLIYDQQYSCMKSLRYIISRHHIDAIFFFTDPRYYRWVFENEKEIRSYAPLVYLNIWDNLPYPLWNKPYYLSCDGLLAISKQTYNINQQLVRGTEKVIRYVPHGIEASYFPMNPDERVLREFKMRIFGDDQPSFSLLFNARNMGRKNISDLILAWGCFTEGLSEDAARQCRLLLHCAPIDGNGTDLIACWRHNCDPNRTRVQFINENLSFKDMNLLYNISDGVILPSYAEGWGLSITEALTTGKMFIATVTGGMQDQMGFVDDHGNDYYFTESFPTNSVGRYRHHGPWCIPIWPVTARSVGSPMTPYIYEDSIRIDDIRAAIQTLYDLGPEKRKANGEIGRQWAQSKGFTAQVMAERVVEGINATIEQWETRDTNPVVVEVKENEDYKLNKNIIWKPWEASQQQ